MFIPEEALPANRTNENEKHVVILIDASGSIDDNMLNDFCDKAIRLFDGCSKTIMHIFFFSDQTRLIGSYKSFQWKQAWFDLSQAYNGTCRGGGSDLTRAVTNAINYLENYCLLSLRDSQFVIFTDGKVV